MKNVAQVLIPICSLIIASNSLALDEAAIEAMQRFVPQSVADCFGYIEDHVIEGPWVMGSSYSVADPYLFTFAQWLEDDGVDPNQFPKVIEHRNRMLDRPAVTKAIEEELGS